MVFLSSKLFAYTGSECISVEHDICFMQLTNPKGLIRFTFLDNELSRTENPGNISKISEPDVLTGNAVTDFYINQQDQGAGSDSLKKMTGSGECSQGYILNNNSINCSGTIIELNSRPALTYKWSPEDRFSNSGFQNTTAVIDSTRTYYLETTHYTSNLIINPDFELGNTGFITTYTYCDGDNCLDPLGDNGYAIGKDATYFHYRFTGNDHTTGSGNFMIVNGARPSLTVWQQTVPVKPQTKYVFGAWICTMISLSPAQIQFSINGSQLGDLYYAPDYVNKWNQVFVSWNSGTQTTATIKILDILPVLVGNDFGLDDLFFGEIVSCTDSIKIIASQNVNLGHDTVITPPDQHLILTPSGGIFDQYNWSTGENTNSISISEPGRYWVSVTDVNGCKSRDTINVKNSKDFIVFPTAFTPNADGANDIFRPVTSNVSKFHMSIYNRWGQLIFETNDINAGWNGMSHGEYYPADLYVYIVSYEIQDDVKPKTLRGTFTLIR